VVLATGDFPTNGGSDGLCSPARRASGQRPNSGSIAKAGPVLALDGRGADARSPSAGALLGPRLLLQAPVTAPKASVFPILSYELGEAGA